MMVLGIETSCDETAAAVVEETGDAANPWRVRSNIVASQVEIHRAWGGVVPEIASRQHVRDICGVVERALADGGATWNDLDALAVTQGPGLVGSLLVGVSFAKAAAWALDKPLVAVNHLAGHIESIWLEHGDIPLPAVVLVVSGGHTSLYLIEQPGQYQLLGRTRDDAAGEAYDKVAKLLGLGYPGGPLIEQQALRGRADAYDFPRGIGRRAELDFSFSGVKTSLRYQIEKMTPADVAARLPDLCASYQQAVLEALTRKTRAALAQGGGRYRSLGVSGGVANNRVLRAALAAEAQRAGITFLAAQPQHTGDNAGMIAFAAWADPAAATRDGGLGLRVEPSAGLADSGAYL
jgi:N6-L-threonylcarbamoyladenine synthase